MASARRHSTLPFLAALAFAGCSIVNPDLIYEQRTGVIDAPVAIVAVLPFYPNSRLSQSAKRSGLEAWEAAAFVTKFMSEAVASRGFAIIPESDVQTAFAGHGQVTPRSDPIAAARLVASEFGAGAVLLGTVTRYRQVQEQIRVDCNQSHSTTPTDLLECASKGATQGIPGTGTLARPRRRLTRRVDSQ